jgi:hypothetical protein
MAKGEKRQGGLSPCIAGVDEASGTENGGGELTLEQILAWADAHYAATGKWPRDSAGPVQDTPSSVKWGAIDAALRRGSRGLPGGSSLSRLLAEHRGVKGPVTVEQILAWADAHHAATGKWPAIQAGEVHGAGAGRLTWQQVDYHLRQGGRGLLGGQSLSRLLAAHNRGPHAVSTRRLSITQILAWADAHHAATGVWPQTWSGPVLSAPGETWEAIDYALRVAVRGLPGGISLARLLEEYRGPCGPDRPRALALEPAGSK